jgi:hypothetical protein
LKFVGLDWCTRKAAVKGDMGTLPEADLHDFEGGTYEFLADVLSNSSNARDGSILLFQHHPFRSPFFAPDFIYAFSHSKQKVLLAMLHNKVPPNSVWGIIGGHWHRWFYGKPFATMLSKRWHNFRCVLIIAANWGRQWETDACKGQWDDAKQNTAVSVFYVEAGRLTS